MTIKPVLLFGYGNPSRGDDALGPKLLDYVEQHCNHDYVELLCDFQLQIEHALDIKNRSLVLFIDASVADIDAYNFIKLQASRDISYSTHAMSPSAILNVYQTIIKQTPPPCFLLTIKAQKIALGEDLSIQAQLNLEQACLFTKHLLENATLKYWLSQLNNSQGQTLKPFCLTYTPLLT
jgi:hydrogenase maturation protease